MLIRVEFALIARLNGAITFGQHPRRRCLHVGTPLAHWQFGEYMIRQERGRLHHASCAARGAHAPAHAGEGDEAVVPAVLTSGAGKTVVKDTALQIFAKRLADKGLFGVVVALAVELAGTGQIKPGLKMLGYRLVQQQRAFGVARIVK